MNKLKHIIALINKNTLLANIIAGVCVAAILALFNLLLPNLGSHPRWKFTLIVIGCLLILSIIILLLVAFFRKAPPPPPPKNPDYFVGREKELEEIHARCQQNRIPVIYADGGTGKTTLAFKYGDLHAATDYPGGVFHVPMEKVKDWDTAMRKLSQKYPDKFASDKTNAGREPSPKELSPDEIRLRLLTLTAGRAFLLILDNVDPEGLELLHQNSAKGLDALFAGGLPATCHAIATARTVDGFSETEKSIPYPLDDLPPEIAKDLVFALDPKSRAEEKSVAALVEFLQGHAWSVELAASDVARNRNRGLTYSQKLQDLKKDFDPAGQHGVAYHKTDERSAAALFQPTQESIRANEPNGDAYLRLAQIAALFPADGVKWHVLCRLWRTLFPDQGTFAEAVAVLGEYSILKVEGKPYKNTADNRKVDEGTSLVSMHRYTQKALLETLSRNKKSSQKFIATVANGLLAYFGFANRDWIALAEQSPLFGHAPFARFNGRNWAVLLSRQPQFADRRECGWAKLSGGGWAWLLSRQPQFADRRDWTKLDGGDWATLLSDQPQFADRCDWAKLGGGDWATLLSDQPRFADRCDWAKLDGWNWATLLSRQPRFADRRECEWAKLDGGDWARLLSRQPQFADRRECDWTKLSGGDWATLLSNQPQFADRRECDWAKLGGWNWATLLSNQPQFADRRECDWAKLDGGDWAWLLSDQPQFADGRDWAKLGGGVWATLLSNQPQFAERQEVRDALKLLRGENLLNFFKWGSLRFADLCDLTTLGKDEKAEALMKKHPDMLAVYRRQCKDKGITPLF